MRRAAAPTARAAAGPPAPGARREELRAGRREGRDAVVRKDGAVGRPVEEHSVAATRESHMADDGETVGGGPSALTMYTLLSAQPLTNWIIRGAIAPQMQCVVSAARSWRPFSRSA